MWWELAAIATIGVVGHVRPPVTSTRAVILHSDRVKEVNLLLCGSVTVAVLLQVVCLVLDTVPLAPVPRLVISNLKINHADFFETTWETDQFIFKNGF